MKMLVVVSDGVGLEAFAIPFTALIEAGVKVVAASPDGRAVMVDDQGANTGDARILWGDARRALEEPVPVTEVSCRDFDGLFIAGNAGAAADLAEHQAVEDLAQAFAASGGVVAPKTWGSSENLARFLVEALAERQRALDPVAPPA